MRDHSKAFVRRIGLRTFSRILRWLFLALIVTASPARSRAEGVTCPVCGETFGESVDECPNDGTDLGLLGKRPPGTRAGKSGAPPPPVAETPPAASEPLLYKRHDEGGERQIAPKGEERGTGYSDRQSRLPADGRVSASGRPKRHAATQKAPRPMPKRDDRGVRRSFEERRRRSWEERESARLTASRRTRDRATARRKLLASLGAPLTSLGGRILWMGEGDHPGPVGAAEIDVNLARYRVRAGFSTLLGVRALAGRNELLFLESLSIGAQWPHRFSPYLLLRGGLGVMATERYGVDQAYLLSAVGLEVGIDSWVHPWLALTPSVGYMRCTVDRAYWHSFTAKFSIGF